MESKISSLYKDNLDKILEHGKCEKTSTMYLQSTCLSKKITECFFSLRVFYFFHVTYLKNILENFGFIFLYISTNHNHRYYKFSGLVISIYSPSGVKYVCT